MPPQPDERARTLFDSPHLVVTGASVRHMLAMKVRALRGSDVADIKLLIRQLDVRAIRQLREIHDEAFPHAPLDAMPWRKEIRTAELVREVLEGRL